MTIKTLLWFTAGGFFTAAYANKLRGLPWMRKPSRHVLSTLVGLVIGYKFHEFEETYEDRLRKVAKAHPYAPIYLRENLKAYQDEMKREQEATKVGTAAHDEEVTEADFEVSEEEEDADDE